MSEKLEIKRVSDYEYWIGRNKTTLLPDQNIIHVIAVGEQTAALATIQKEINYKLFELTECKISFLIDLNQCGKNSPEARQTWKLLSESEKTNKVATYGLHPVARVIASFVIGISQKSNQRFFKTKNEAMAWLEEK
jgi:hypothetical protein